MEASTEAPEMYARGVVVAQRPDRRCDVRLTDGRVVVGRMPYFQQGCDYRPTPGEAVVVYLDGRDGEFLLVGFPPPSDAGRPA